ncbi:373_t:CDS:2, partial [Cetraspora pellucida]
ESGFKPASEIDPVTQAITDLKESSSNIKTTSRSSIKPNNKKFDIEVNTNQNKTSKIPFNETTNIISSDNTSIKKQSSELQLGKKR